MLIFLTYSQRPRVRIGRLPGRLFASTSRLVSCQTHLKQNVSQLFYLGVAFMVWGQCQGTLEAVPKKNKFFGF